jgi:signal transduction histidine kinase
LAVVFLSLTLSSLTFAQLPKEEFQKLRSSIYTEGKKSPLEGIKKVDEILTRFNGQIDKDHQLAKNQQIRLLYLKAVFQKSADRIEETLSTLGQAKELAEDIAEPGILYSYYDISAGAFDIIGLYELALENYMKALKQASYLADTRYIRQTENNIGYTYLKLGFVSKAEYHFKRFYDNAVEQGLNSPQSVGLSNLGEVAYYNKEFDKAENFHLEALAIRKRARNEYLQSLSMYHLGRVYLAKKEYDKAEQYLTLSILRFKKKNIYSQVLKPKIELARLFIQKEQTQNAKVLLDEVVLLANQYKKLKDLKNALSERSKLRRQQEDFEGALSDLNAYNLVMEEINERKSSIGMAHIISQTDLLTKEMALKQLEQAHLLTISVANSEKKIGFIILLSFLFMLLIGWFLLIRINRRKRELQGLVSRLQNTQDKLVESEKMRAMTTLVSGMAHQLNTPLGLVITANSSLQSQVETLVEKLKDKSLTQSQLSHFLENSNELISLSQRSSEKAAQMIETFKMMSAKLEMSERKQFELIGFLKEIVPKIIHTHNTNIAFKISGEEIVISNYPSVLLKIINQFINNSFKHAFNAVTKPFIEFKIKIGLNEVEIHYTDNGIGIEPDKKVKIFDPFYTTSLNDGSLGLGLNIIYNSVAHLMHGQVECICDNKGAHFIVVIPKCVLSGTVEVRNTRVSQ